MSDVTPLEHLVQTPLGTVFATLDRRGMGLGERGGFEARWASPEERDEGEVLGLEPYRRVVKAHLGEVYLAQEKREPPAVTLNLASHQLVDDLTGWTKRNARTTF